MATTTLAKIKPYNGLCKFCLNYTKVQNYVEDTYEQEGIQKYTCSAIPGLEFDSIVVTDIDADSLTLKSAATNISNCNRFNPGAVVEITSVSYDAVTTTLTINYTVDGVVGTPNIDFYFVGDNISLGTDASISDGSVTKNIVVSLADGSYYLYAKLSSTEQSVIYPFSLTTS